MNSVFPSFGSCLYDVGFNIESERVLAKVGQHSFPRGSQADARVKFRQRRYWWVGDAYMQGTNQHSIVLTKYFCPTQENPILREENPSCAEINSTAHYIASWKSDWSALSYCGRRTQNPQLTRESWPKRLLPFTRKELSVIGVISPRVRFPTRHLGCLVLLCRKTNPDVSTSESQHA